MQEKEKEKQKTYERWINLCYELDYLWPTMRVDIYTILQDTECKDDKSSNINRC